MRARLPQQVRVAPRLRAIASVKRLAGLLIFTACASNEAPRPDAGPGGRADASVSPDASSGRPDATSGDAGGATAGPCPGNTPLLQYSLTPLQTLPALGDIQLPNLHPSTIITSAGSGTTHSLRFDFCTDGASVTLYGVFFREHDFEVPRWYIVDPSVSALTEREIQTPKGAVTELRIPPSAAQVAGLSEAIEGDLAALRVRIIATDGLLVHGHAAFVAVARGDVSAGAITYNSLTVIVGGFGAGDAFSGLVCPFGEQAISARFALGTAAFAVEGCTFLGGGETFGYRFTKLSVEDSSPELMAADRRKHELTGETEVNAALDYRWNHHNACDSFHLTLPHANYAASTAPLAGCGTQVPEAPPRMFDEPSGNPVKYRKRYYGGTWVDGTIDGCTHYLRCP